MVPSRNNLLNLFDSRLEILTNDKCVSLLFLFYKNRMRMQYNVGSLSPYISIIYWLKEILTKMVAGRQKTAFTGIA